MTKKASHENGETSARHAISRLIQTLELDEYRFPPFDNWGELQDAREEAGLEAEEPEELDGSEKLKVSLACLDALHLYVSNIAFAMFTRLCLLGHKTPKIQASFTLFSGIAADIGAIGVLCRHG